MRIRLMVAVAFIPLVAACGGGSSGGGSTVDSSGGAGAAGGGAAGGGVAATCIAPMLTVKPDKVHPGDEVQVSGEWFADGCNDVVINGQEPQPAPAITGMTLVVSQGGESWPVATDVDAAGEHYAFDVSITIPAEVHAGKATVQAKDYGFPVDITVTD